MQFFRNVVGACLVIVACVAPTDGQTIHVLVVGDLSPSAKWGVYEPNLTFDLIRMRGLFFSNSPEDKLRFESLYIEDDSEATPANVAAAVRRMKPAANDTVVFYYTGHGGLDDRGSYFDLAGGKLYREEVLRLLTQAKPRLAVMLTDCCNSRSDGRQQVYAVPHFEHPPRFTPLFQSLMMRPSGVVDVNSAMPGQSAFFLPGSKEMGGERGSIFTARLAEWADKNKNRQASWDELVQDVGMAVHLTFRAGYPKGVSIAKGATVQTDQNVFARTYPGMPEARGPRAGVQVRDQDGRGAQIVHVEDGSPAARAYRMASEQYVALRPGQLITAVNGRRIGGAAELIAAVKESPRIMRVTVGEGNVAEDYLVRLRY